VATEVVNRQRFALVDRSRIERLVAGALDAVGRGAANLTVALVRDRVTRDLNRQYRGIDRSADVLSFPAEDKPAGSRRRGGDASNYLGDIVVSTDAAQQQAREAGHSFEREIDELVLHGVLHLCGFDHETDRGEMNRLELRLRRKLLESDS
jgi:probable rRNA maturation factor